MPTHPRLRHATHRGRWTIESNRYLPPTIPGHPAELCSIRCAIDEWCLQSDCVELVVDIASARFGDEVGECASLLTSTILAVIAGEAIAKHAERTAGSSARYVIAVLAPEATVLAGGRLRSVKSSYQIVARSSA
jgi:hypothetical protein